MPTFSTWFLIWLALIYLPRILHTGVHWLNLEHFLETRPNKEWLFSGYELFLILWLPISVVGTARYFQGAPTNRFYLYVIFIPTIGIGILKGLIEMTTGIGWFYGFRLSNEPVSIGFRPFGQRFLKLFWYRFTLDQQRVRIIGTFRLVMNTAVLITLIILERYI